MSKIINKKKVKIEIELIDETYNNAKIIYQVFNKSLKKVIERVCNSYIKDTLDDVCSDL